MRLIRPIRYPDRPHLRPHIRQRRILTHALCTIRLHRAINHIQRHIRHQDLGLCDFHEGLLGVAGVDCGSGVEHDESGCVDFDARFGYPLEDYALGGEQLAEGLLVLGICSREEPVQRFFGLVTGVSSAAMLVWCDGKLDLRLLLTA